MGRWLGRGDGIYYERLNANQYDKLNANYAGNVALKKTFKDFDDLLMNGTMADLDEAARRACLAIKQERKSAGNGWRKGQQAWPK